MDDELVEKLRVCRLRQPGSVEGLEQVVIEQNDRLVAALDRIVEVLWEIRREIRHAQP